MQITVNNDFNNGPNGFTQAQINSFLADEQTALNLLPTVGITLREDSQSFTNKS